MTREEHKRRTRKLLVQAKPEWKGLIWFNKESITVRGVITVWFYELHDSPAANAKSFLNHYQWTLDNP